MMPSQDIDQKFVAAILLLRRICFNFIENNAFN